MSGIYRRTVFYEVGSGGEYRPWDFAKVTTGIGAMLEPRTAWFTRDRRNNSGNLVYDPTDEIARIDDMKELSSDLNQQFMGENLHGGRLWQRTGR